MLLVLVKHVGHKCQEFWLRFTRRDSFQVCTAIGIACTCTSRVFLCGETNTVVEWLRVCDVYNLQMSYWASDPYAENMHGRVKGRYGIFVLELVAIVACVGLLLLMFKMGKFVAVVCLACFFRLSKD